MAGLSSSKFWPKEAVAPDFLAGGGEMGARMRALDWARTPLGPPERWPQSLKTIVRVMLDSRYAMWMLWGPELTFFCNDAYLPTVGIKRDWVLGARSDKVWEEIWPDIGPRIAQVLEHGHATWDEALLLFLERSGFPEETYHTFSYSPVYDDENHVAGMLCVVTEVTQRVVGERRLRVLRDLAARAVSATGVEDSCRGACEVLRQYPFSMPFGAIYLLDPDANTARRVAQVRELPEQVIPAVLHASSSTWPLAPLLASEAVQHVRDLPALGINVPAGPWPDLVRDAFLLPLKGPGGERLAGFLIAAASPRRALDEAYRTFFDLVARQIAAGIADAQANEAEHRRAEALAEIDRAKTIFFSNVSHEFRTPLTLMLGPLEAAASDPATPSPVRAQLELAQRNSLRLLKLVNSLLDFARLEAGRMQASYEACDLSAVTREIASSFQSAVEHAGLRFKVDCPPLTEPVYIDREMWEQVVLNLLSNAFKFTLKGEIAVRMHGDGTQAVLEVADSGVGIPEQELPHLFERFHRVQGVAERTQEGSGIGLALVQELVDLHGGSIEAASQLGQGTTFRVRLPFGSSHLAAERIKTAPTRASTALGAQAFVQEALRWLPEDGAAANTATSNGMLGEPSSTALDQRFAATFGARIVLADDNADMRAYVRSLLVPHYSIELVADGVAALEAVRTRRADLLIADVMMPRLDGFGLLEALRSDESLRDTPVILLSARAGEESRIEGLEAGADDYLVKPFSSRELLARVGALLELTKLRREHEARLRLALASIQDQFYMLDAQWRYTLVNSRVIETTGKSEAELIGHSIFELFPDLKGSHFARELAVAAQTQRPRRFEFDDPNLNRCFENAVYPAGDGIAVLVTDITERKRSEAAAAHLAAIVSSSDDAIVSKTLEGIIQSWNGGAERIFGWSAGEAIGQSIPLIIPAERLDEEQQILETIRKGGRIEHFETVRQTKSGRRVDVALTISPVRNAAGMVIGASKIARDITERRRIEALLGCQRQALQRLAEGDSLEEVLGFLIEAAEQHLGAGLVGSILLLNESGTHFERAIGPSLPAAFHEAVRGVAISSSIGICSRAIATRAPIAAEDFSADPQWARFAEAVAPFGLRAGWSTPIMGSDGRALGAFANYYREPRNPTPADQKWVEVIIRTAAIAIERKKAEERLRAEKIVQEVLGKVSQSLVAAQLDPERVVQIAIDAATELSGAAFGAFFYNMQDEQGEWYSVYKLSGAPREAFASFPQPRNTAIFGPTFRGEAVVRSDDITADPRYGRNLPYRGMPKGHLPVRSYLAVPVKTLSGRVIGGLFFGHPECGVFTERVERLVLAIAAQAAVAFDNAALHHDAEREIEQRRRFEMELNEAGRRKDEFLAMLAHELRNPLAPIANAAALLSQTASGDQRSQAAVGMIKRQMTQLTRLVDDLLDVSRITQGRIQLRKQPIELGGVITQAIETVEPQLRQKHHKLSVTASSYVPLYVMGDFARLVQCIGNLLANAAKYTEQGGEIWVRTHADDASVFVEVADSDVGIPPELLPRVFDLFVQSERTLDRAQGGLGIGLAVVKRLVEMHDGEVIARSEGPGRGSSFQIRLPRVARPMKQEADTAAIRSEPRRILIVDDNVDAANSLAMLLATHGHETEVAYGAKEALARIETLRPDVALLDIGLPEMNGYELAKRLRAIPMLNDLRLIALTGYGQSEDRQRALSVGFSGHLVKPVDLAALEKVLAADPASSSNEGASEQVH
jgi:PAS domain S-box-containing protein